MRGTAGTVLLGILAALPTAASVAPQTPEDRHEKHLAPGDGMEFVSLPLERPVIHEITCGGKRLTLRAMPGGLIRFVGSDAVASVWILETEGRAVAFKLRPGERASVWPIRRVEVRGKVDGFKVILTAADWAFVVRADRTLKAGLHVRCHGVSCTLLEGQRIDADREDEKIVFRVIGDEWPGKLVEAPEPTPEERAKEEEGRLARAVAAEEVPPAPAPPLPLLATGWAAWEIRPAPPVSP